MRAAYFLVLSFIVLLIPVNVFAWPSGSCIAEITGSRPVCVGEGINLTACGEPAGGTCTWSATPGLTPSGCTATFTGLFEGVFWVSVWYTGSGFKCNDVDKIPVGAKDQDGDGHYSKDSCKLPNDDCDDTNPKTYPGAPEICDGNDNDCDGQVDESTDADSDGHYAIGSCRTPNNDCNDSDNEIYGGATEVCDGKDNNCNASIDEGFDQDGDGFTSCNNDCNDNDRLVYPENGQCCPVPHLTPLTDPLALSMEGGERVIYDNVTEAFRLAAVCFLSAITEAGGTYEITSLYRPPQYQQHLWEVWNRYSRLVNDTTAECSALRSQVITEFTSHRLLRTQEPGRGRSAHSDGNAMDVNAPLTAGQNIDTLANNCGLYRPYPQTDSVHFELRR